MKICLNWSITIRASWRLCWMFCLFVCCFPLNAPRLFPPPPTVGEAPDDGEWEEEDHVLGHLPRHRHHVRGVVALRSHWQDGGRNQTRSARFALDFYLWNVAVVLDVASVRPRFAFICDSFTRSSASWKRNYSVWDFVRQRLESVWVYFAHRGLGQHQRVRPNVLGNLQRCFFFSQSSFLEFLDFSGHVSSLWFLRLAVCGRKC